MRSRIFNRTRRQTKVVEVVRFKNSAPAATVEDAPKPDVKPNGAVVRHWVKCVADHVNEDISGLEQDLRAVTTWSELLALLEDENYHRLRRECQNRLGIPEHEVSDALLRRWQDAREARRLASA